MTVKKKNFNHYTKQQLAQQIEDFATEIAGLLDNKEALEIQIASYKRLAEQKGGETKTFLEKFKAAEIREKKYKQALRNLVDILNDNKIGRRIKGWYWHIQEKQPVYIDGVSMDGMTGYALNHGPDGRFIGSVTDTFDYDNLIRIDRNLDNPF